MDMNAIGSHIRHKAGIVSESLMRFVRDVVLTKYGHLSGGKGRCVAARGSCYAIPGHGGNGEVEYRGRVQVCTWRRKEVSITMTKGGRCQVKWESVVTNKTCASLRQISTSRAQRAESVYKGRERHKVYKEQQDLSGVLKTDRPLG
jgi:hypothetical protein